MQNSYSTKFPNLHSIIETDIGFPQEIPHQLCSCIHCLNNTKPLVKPKAPRFTSLKQKKLNDSQAFRTIIKQLAQCGFSGRAEAPDSFIIEGSSLIYESKSGKMKVKQGQTNMEIKRHFDDQRRKLQSNINNVSQINGSIAKFSLAEIFPNSIIIPSKLPKQIAIMTYKDNTQQIINETLLSKILEKRKNDPFWEQISHIIQIPPQLKHPMQKHTYHYQRTSQTLPQLIPIMQKMGRQIDNIYQKSLKNRYKQDQQDLDINPQFKLGKSSSQKMKRNQSLFQTSLKPKNSMFDFDYLIVDLNEQLAQLQTSSMEIVAFLEMTTHYRILNALFEYFIDQRGRFFICNIKDVIWEELKGTQLTMIHDRYTHLQEIGGEQLVETKNTYDKLCEEELWKICTAVVNEALQIRKIQLNITIYKKPNNDALLKIFLKIFPDFKSQSIFKSINWKNQLPEFIAQIRKKINKVIRQDEGIRILRRFNIEFRRTFQ